MQEYQYGYMLCIYLYCIAFPNNTSITQHIQIILATQLLQQKHLKGRHLTACISWPLVLHLCLTVFGKQPLFLLNPGCYKKSSSTKAHSTPSFDPNGLKTYYKNVHQSLSDFLACIKHISTLKRYNSM